MARDYGKIKSSFWPDEKVQGWSMATRGFASYLLTNEHTTALGCFRLPLAYICADLKIPAGEARAFLADLVKANFIAYDEPSAWIWIRNYITYNQPENGNVWKHVRRLAAAMPSALPFRKHVLASIEPPPEQPPKPLENGSETVSEGSLRTQPNRAEPNRAEVSDANASGADAPVPPIADQIWGSGLVYLVSASGRPEREVRSLLGKWRQGGRRDGELLAVLIEAQAKGISEPVAWIETRLGNGGRQQQSSGESRFEQFMSAAAASAGHERGGGAVRPDASGSAADDYGGATVVALAAARG